MNPQVLHYATKEFTGLTGSASVSWDVFDFTSSPFPLSITALRCVIDLDCIAIPQNITFGTYPSFYCAKIIYYWKPSTGTIDSNQVFAQNASQMTWSVGNTGGAGSLRVTATGAATLAVLNVAMAARIAVWGDS